MTLHGLSKHTNREPFTSCTSGKKSILLSILSLKNCIGCFGCVCGCQLFTAFPLFSDTSRLDCQHKTPAKNQIYLKSWQEAAQLIHVGEQLKHYRYQMLQLPNVFFIQLPEVIISVQYVRQLPLQHPFFIENNNIPKAYLTISNPRQLES